jgi:hypothetical protein
MKRYTLISEPAAHLEARREVVVEARNDGEAYDQAADHVAAEVPYHCTISIARTEDIGAGAPRLTKINPPVVGKTATFTPQP